MTDKKGEVRGMYITENHISKACKLMAETLNKNGISKPLGIISMVHFLMSQTSEDDLLHIALQEYIDKLMAGGPDPEEGKHPLSPAIETLEKTPTTLN